MLLIRVIRRLTCVFNTRVSETERVWGFLEKLICIQLQMYLLREGKGIIRTFTNYQEALDRYIYITKSNIDDVELYEMHAGSCSLIYMKESTTIELLEHAVNCINEYLERYPKNS